MEVAHSAPETFSNSARTRNLLPLSQLVEDTRKSGNVPHHLLETRVFAKLKSNSVVQAEPSELHFSGFEVGKGYKKILKLVNISSDVLSVHILPPQTKNFQIKYTKKCRLVPGLAYTVTVNFHPDEWRYFCDNIRIHCEAEENLLVPVHAYPVINDLHIPSHISLPPVPLGQSISHVIPLKCSCPIDFEFQVHCLQPHEAFTVRPLSGIIPANGKTELKVTFTPVRYCTADITLQLVISQFNSKPVVWTVTGSSSPYLPPSKKDGDCEDDNVLVGEQKTVDGKPLGSHHRPKMALSLPKGVDKKRKAQLQISNADFPTNAGLSEIQTQDKTRSKNLAMSTKPADQNKKMKESTFSKNAKQKKRGDLNRWKVDVGNDKLKIRKEQEEAVGECKLKYSGKSVAISKSSPKRSSRRVLRNAGQLPESTGQLKVRSKALRLFQQAVRKVVHQCRRNKTLQADKESDEQLLKLTPEKLLPFSFPTFLPEDQPDELAVNALGRVPVRPPVLDMKPSTPIFDLKVPQYYRIMGYQPVSVYDAAATFIPSHLMRTLRTGAEDEILPVLACTSADLSEDEPDRNAEEHEGSNQDLYTSLSFSASEALLKPPNVHPLQIFNPAPNVHAFKPAPLYLECDLDFHLCPLPRYTSKSMYAPATQKKFLDRKDVIKGVMTWKKFPSTSLKILSRMSTLTGDHVSHMSDPFTNILLPTEAPPALQDLPDSIRDDIQTGLSDGSDLRLTPEMVEAEFGLSGRSSATSLREDEDDGTPTPKASATTSREQCEQPLESNHNIRLGTKVMQSFKQLKSLGRTSSLSSHENK
ncbi:cilia- and flagella-associated protein 221 [Triplophysa rosa]|uniref:Primary ciliary dyskinesia protein 1 n=1 Tax=Triplophysa rosa TaxID=992332 RepID=A0A9W8C964_TRIRA|nr:cilia- and flagella-associated protein 221 [Triplophysa rosa]XP_057188810.1 cilia- and flagella-associated protein 221 [Triplophysa rosa]KAI7810989.1 putative primary ciliary dyskinesia protein 1 [Triplophysa rosa]